MSTLGHRLRVARMRIGLTQEELAAAVGTTRSSISDYERDHVHAPVELVPRICRALLISADWLLDVPPPMPQTERAKAEYRDRIVAACAEAYEVTPGAILGKSRAAGSVAARHAAMHLVTALTGLNTIQAGAYFGRDHSSIIHALKRVDQWEEYDAPMWGRLQAAMSILGRSRAPVAVAAPRYVRAAASETGDQYAGSHGLLEASRAMPLFRVTTDQVAA